MKERRQHTRIKERDSVTVTVLSAPQAPPLENQKFFCTTSDLSETGISFHVHTDVPTGAVLEMKIELPDPPDVYVHQGTVVWTREVPEDLVLVHVLGIKITATRGKREDQWRDAIRDKLSRLDT
jgi:hypothetical protein